MSAYYACVSLHPFSLSLPRSLLSLPLSLLLSLLSFTIADARPSSPCACCPRDVRTGGQPHGRCLEIVRSEDGSEWLSDYEGVFAEGERHGGGVERTSHGTYDGTWVRGMRHGTGRFEASSGWVYRGQFSNGSKHGKGVLTTSMGHRFVGDWLHDHMPEGMLTGRFLGQYKGQFKATGSPDWPLVREGRGSWEGLHGDTYVGTWREDYFDGIGVHNTRFAKYEGAFVRGERHGHGLLVASNGDWYEGAWAHGQFEGDGQRSDASGVFTGMFFQGKRHGYGTLVGHNGVRFKGQWHMGMRQGGGEQQYPDGSTFRGEWDSDVKVRA